MSAFTGLVVGMVLIFGGRGDRAALLQAAWFRG